MKVIGFLFMIYYSFMLDQYGFDLGNVFGLLFGIALVVGFSVLSRVFIVIKDNIHAPK